jgi:hypothetical protein
MTATNIHSLNQFRTVVSDTAHRLDNSFLQFDESYLMDDGLHYNYTLIAYFMGPAVNIDCSHIADHI